MIRSLTGKISNHVPGGVILTTNGVGYLVAVPLRSLPPLASITTLYTHHHVREDMQALYGFESLPELTLFERLLDVSSIGPKSAMAVLSVATADEIAQAIERDDAAFFTRVPGLGKKSALKIILELKGKLAADAENELGSAHRDLVDALETLGYAPRDIQTALTELPAAMTDTQEALTWTLKQLGRVRK